MSKELNVKIKGASSLPAVAATVKKREGGKKLNNGDLIILFAYDTVVAELADLDKDKVIEYLDKETRATINEVRDLNKRLSRVMYGIVVGHGWFTDIDFDAPTATVPVKRANLAGSASIDTSLELTIVLEEKEVKI